MYHGEAVPLSSRSFQVRTDSVSGLRMLTTLLSKRTPGASSAATAAVALASAATRAGCRFARSGSKAMCVSRAGGGAGCRAAHRSAGSSVKVSARMMTMPAAAMSPSSATPR